jgi:hypothetical protein
MHIPYDDLNREERSACAHLFRLLHEGLATDPDRSPLARVLALLRDGGLKDVNPASARSAVVLMEVAFVRDAFWEWKGDMLNLPERMDTLVKLLARGRSYTPTPWSELAEELRDVSRTHPAQILIKAEQQRIGIGPKGTLRDSERDVQNRECYSELRAAFQAKPDLVIVLPERLLVFEAKLTEGFESQQLKRTKKLAELWCSQLLCGLFGYPEPPPFTVGSLGDEKTEALLTWQNIQRIAVDTYPQNDRTRIALDAAVEVLNRRR